jgi:hypothetical protein
MNIEIITAMVTNEVSTEIKVSNKVTARNRLAKYRSKRLRLDYYPAEDVIKFIKRIRALNPSVGYQAIIDDLLRKADKAISGNNLSNGIGTHK